ncbi:MAG: hypothetical protein AAF959_26510 [Cyanobacteria bacterium P01_D01_bin.56]
MIFERLQNFRQTIYDLLGSGKDTLFDLMDAVLTSPEASAIELAVGWVEA